jgi:YHS domain-containing protein
MIMEETKDEIRQEMETGEKEETVYDEEGREKLVEDGEISPEEAGFMEGAEDDGEQGKCANCGAALMDAENTLETRIDGKVYWFCSDHCLQKYKEKNIGEEQA